MFETFTATFPPRRVCPRMSPIGSAITIATSIATIVSCRCSISRFGMPELPDQ